MTNSQRDARGARGTTLLAAYVLVGQLLGISFGGLEASRQTRPAIATHGPVYAPDRHDKERGDEDADERDPFVIWPLVGLAAGTIVGAGATQIHLATRRWQAEHSRVG
jgi:hypothetical protein